MNGTLVTLRLRSSVYFVALTLAVGIPAGAATILVTSLSDSGTGSLRQAIADASSGDAVSSTNGTITLTSGELFIDKSLDIIGPGATNLAVSGSQTSRVFNIAVGATVKISGVT